MRRIRALMEGAAAATCALAFLASAGCSSSHPDTLDSWNAKPRANSLVQEDVNRWRRMVREGQAPLAPDSASDAERGR